MCQIFVSAGEATFLITKAAAHDLYFNNSDGLGFVDFDNPGQAVKIVPQSFEQAWAFLEEHVQGKRGVLHWRLRTSGALDVDRVHPYVINDEFYLIHNGVMREWESKPTTVNIGGVFARDEHGGIVLDDKGRVTYATPPSVKKVYDGKSDTQNLAEWLAPMLDVHPGIVTTPQFQHLLGQTIGSGNRLVIVNRVTGEATIINEDTGHWCLPGIWQANTYAGDYVFVDYSQYGKTGLNAGLPGKLSKRQQKKLRKVRAGTTSAADYKGTLTSPFNEYAGLSAYEEHCARASKLAESAGFEVEDYELDDYYSDLCNPANDPRDLEVDAPDYPKTTLSVTSDVVAWFEYCGIDQPHGLWAMLREFALQHASENSIRLDCIEDAIAEFVAKRDGDSFDAVSTNLESLLRAAKASQGALESA